MSFSIRPDVRRCMNVEVQKIIEIYFAMGAAPAKEMNSISMKRLIVDLLINHYLLQLFVVG